MPLVIKRTIILSAREEEEELLLNCDTPLTVTSTQVPELCKREKWGQ